MTLKRVTQEDAGEYRCEISAPLDAVSLGETNVTLKVLGTAAAPLWRDPARLDAQADAFPLCALWLYLPCCVDRLVPPHTPSCDVPSGAVTGSVVQLRCRDRQSIPPATYSWFKDNQLISPPRHPNATYVINSHMGILVSVGTLGREIRRSRSSTATFSAGVRWGFGGGCDPLGSTRGKASG